MKAFFHFTRSNLYRIAGDCRDECGIARRKAFMRFANGVLHKYGAKNLKVLDANYLDEVAFLFLARMMKVRKANR